MAGCMSFASVTMQILSHVLLPFYYKTHIVSVLRRYDSPVLVAVVGAVSGNGAELLTVAAEGLRGKFVLQGRRKCEV